MPFFISYCHKTGSAVAMQVAEQLLARGASVSWLPDKVQLDQLDKTVTGIVQNCVKCIVVWSQEASEWQQMEVVTSKAIARQRFPTQSPSEMFTVLRNCNQGNKLFPLLTDAEHLTYHADCIPDISDLVGYVPSGLPLTYDGKRRPVLTTFPCFNGGTLTQGVHGFAGHFEPDDDQQTVAKQCWVVLEDVYRNFYLQNPRPTITHKNRWFVPNVCVGKEIIRMHLLACGPASHDDLSKRTRAQDWAGMPREALPTDYSILGSWP